MTHSVFISDIVRLALTEDVGAGDVTTSLTVSSETRIRGHILARENMVLSGLTAAVLTFRTVDPDIEFMPQFQDGDSVPAGNTFALLSGSAQSILTAERTALNFIMRLSGVATLTARYVEAVRGTRARIVDTRKTTPGMRALEKDAVRHGGGHNHRFGLYDGILIKDNHIAAAGSITNAVTRAKTLAPHTLKVEVEVEDLDGLKEAMDAGADIVLLDNMSPETMSQAVEIARGRVLLEASGGINLDTVSRVAATGVDLISVGALTHSAPTVDISLEFDKDA